VLTSVVAVTAGALLGATSASAATFTVTSGADSGAGTLRAAITGANVDATADAIEFDLGGVPIAPTSALPAITQPVTIDGTTDPSAGSAEIDGTSAGVLANGLSLTAAGSTLTGLNIHNFALFGVSVTGSNNVVANGTIGANGSGGVSVSSGTGNTVGGVSGGLSIEGNTGPGIAISSDNNEVTSNTIGEVGMGNTGAGVAISGSATGNRIGGETDGNQVSGNGGAGVQVTGTGTGNAIIGNAILENDGLGIDLGTAGVTGNDTGDGDSGANALQNFPVLADPFTNGGGNATVTGSLNSTANTDFRIDFYGAASCDPSGHGEGDTWVASANVHTDGSGDAAFSPSIADPGTRFITATATGPGNTGTGSTSEFSICSAGPSTGGVVSNGTVQLGVNNTGDLNYSCVSGEPGCPGPSAAGAGPVGLRYVPLNLDSTSPGCSCEGWGMADDGAAPGSKLSGYANQSKGTANVNVNSFSRSADGTTAISDVTISDPGIAGAQMHVVQNYHPSTASPNLYEDTVTVTNTGTTNFNDLRYRRVMDWDIEPTAFSEWSTIQGTSPQLLYDSDDGFASADPLEPRTSIMSDTACGAGYTGPCAFTDLGPADHGALFDLGFGALAQGANRKFRLYYGAAADETSAVNALNAGGAQLYSLGESDCPNGGSVAGCDTLPANAGPSQGKPATFMFGFVTTIGDLSITKTDSPDPVALGQDLTYTLTVHNNGPDPAAGVSVDDQLPAGVTFKSASASNGGSCSGTATVHCTFASIANNGSVTVTIVVTPTQTGALSNTATVSSASEDAVPGNNSSTQGTTVNPAGSAPPPEDPPTAAVADTKIVEGDVGTTTMHLPVSLSKVSTSTVTLGYSTGAAGDTATPGADYSTTSGTVTFDPGQTSKNVDVAIIGDTLDEPDETFTVTLASPTNATIADAAATGEITDDDAPPTLSVADGSVTEGDSGTKPLPLAVNLSSASGRTITVHYATGALSDTATPDVDYARTTGTLTFAGGTTTQTVNVPVNGDTAVEPDEVLTLTLDTPAQATLADGSGRGTIVNDDEIGVPPVVPVGDLFCGTQHRGKCKGLKVKDEFDRPGNASWTFGAYNPTPGNSGGRVARSKPIRLGNVKRKIRKAGKVRFVFKLKPSAKTRRIEKKVRKQKPRRLRIKRTFKPLTGHPEVVTRNVKLSRYSGW
jgi:uncharacterized repeat protein (TIGR01451 family)